MQRALPVFIYKCVYIWLLQGQRNRDNLLVDRWSWWRLQPPNSTHDVSKQGTNIICCKESFRPVAWLSVPALPERTFIGFSRTSLTWSCRVWSAAVAGLSAGRSWSPVRRRRTRTRTRSQRWSLRATILSICIWPLWTTRSAPSCRTNVTGSYCISQLECKRNQQMEAERIHVMYNATCRCWII